MTSLDQREQATAGALTRPGRTDLGLISLDDRVVAKLAAQAALEISDAGAAAPRVLGRAVSGVGALGVRQTSLSALPKATAEVDGGSDGSSCRSASAGRRRYRPSPPRSAPTSSTGLRS